MAEELIMDDQKPKRRWPWILVALLIGAVATGGTLWWMNEKVKTERDQKEQLQSQVQTLRDEVDELKKSKEVPDPTSNWKSYTNPTGQFSIKYPPTWKVRYCKAVGTEFPELLVLGPSDAALSECGGPHWSGQMSIGFRAKGTKGSVDDYKSYDFNTIVSEKNITIGTLAGFRAEWVRNRGPLEADPPEVGKGSRTVYYRLEGKNVSYIANYDQYTSGPFSQNVLADFDRMVQTLQAS